MGAPTPRVPLCVVCLEQRFGNGWFCEACQRSYDRARASDDGTILATIMWAANRARRIERQRHRRKGAK